MTKVTYLFGAGASAGIRSEDKSKERLGLPVVNELPGRINRLIQEIRDKNLWLPENEPFENMPNNEFKRKYQMGLIGDWEWLSFEAHPSKHASVDTLAKKLFLKENWSNKGDEYLKRLKNALSMFFIFEQTRIPADIRYDTFFASVLNVDRNPEKIQLNLPENIRIISWNYDYQFERVFSDYVDKHDLGEIQRMLNVVSKYSEIKPRPGFSIVKLNGTTIFSGKGKLDDLEPLSNVTVQLNLDAVSAFTNYYALVMESPQNYYSNLSFAWEEENLKGETIIDKAIACAKDTEILVVVGYSFPFFNRKVDRAIFGKDSMKNLKRVYFQAPAPYHEQTRTRFQAIRQDIAPQNLIAYDEVESFLLPDELEL